MGDHRQPALDRAERARQISRVLWITLVLNWAVSGCKIAFGAATNCMVIIADGLHSFSDGTSNIVGLAGIALSAHPADEDHPYGHQKYETLASTGIAFLLFAVAFGIYREAAIGLFRARQPEVNALSFVLMGATLLVNIGVTVYERRRARELKSELLYSDSWHTLTDVFVTLTIFAALAGIWFHMPVLDSVFSFAIATVIVVTAFGILKKSSDVLCDHAVLDAHRIEAIARGVDGVRDCHEVRSRGHADDVYVDLHVLVDSEMTVIESHRIANIIENNIRRDIPSVRDVVVHVEPLSHGHDEIEEFRG